MKNKQAFTLIELLVVVLIIGILAAVALPQYNLAVEKARATEAITVLKSIKEAQERYYLANGSYTDKFDELDIALPGTVSVSGLSITLTSGITVAIQTKLYAYAVNKTNTNTFMFVYSHINDADAGKRICHAKKNNLKANQLCKSLGGKNPKDLSSCALGPCTVYEL
ncbi:type IV pilin protein [Candidatus Avelusimicrobium caledoniensis]|uniref:type IV pilin protein n=1 Tax=Candidatus Avelusimicrobium caledoniensis TaxID=3416220 RepID=UPI003D113812